MANRNTLHKSHLTDFKNWLTDEGIPWRKGKGDFEVIQVHQIGFGWWKIYSRIDMPEHYTVQDRLMPLVREFIKDLKRDEK